MASELDNDLDAADAAADQAIARVQATIADLQQQLADAKAQNPTPANLEKIKSIQAKLDALDPTNPTTLKT